METQNPRKKKIIIQLLFSIFVFTFFFSCFSLVSFQFPSLHSLNKNCIFLICNGLLFFLAKTSGLVPSSMGFDLSELQISLEIKEVLVQNGVVGGGEKETESKLLNVDGSGGGGGGNCYFEDVGKEIQSENGLLEEEILVQNGVYKREEEEESELLNVDGDGGGGGGGGGNCHFEEVEKEIESENGLLLVDELEQVYRQEVEVEEDDHMSTEELNKKFEDFIKRMKEEIRIEAQQQLVMVK